MTTRKLSTPFAINSSLKNIVPISATSEQTKEGLADYTNGWTAINKLPIENGGQPPYMEDMNGLLGDITGNIVDLCKGLPQYFDSDYSTLIGGYPIGARLVLNDNSATVISTISNNTNNPNSNMTGWVLVSASSISYNNSTQQVFNDSIANLTSGISRPILKSGSDNAEYNYNLLQSEADTGNRIVLPNGVYYLSQAIKPSYGQTIEGVSSPFFQGVIASTMLINTNEGGGIIDLGYTGTDYNLSVRLPKLHNFGMQADYPIMYSNPKNAIVDDGNNTNVPYVQRGEIKGMYIIARTQGTGVGISACKMFDSQIENNYIANFDINLVLYGCDLNTVRDNRFSGAYRYHILDLSVASFGSQNEIVHNDIVDMGANGGTPIKTTARHARIYDNYLEQSASYTILGFIDASYMDMPSDYVTSNNNTNTSGKSWTTDIVANRIDGFANATKFVYRYQPDGQYYGRIIDVGTNQSETSVTKLYLTDASGNLLSSLPVAYNQVNLANFEFTGNRFDNWDGFSTNAQIDSVVTTKNIKQFSTKGDNSLNYTLRDVYPYLRLQSSSFILQNGASNTLYLLYPQGSKAVFQYQRTSTLRVRVRTTGTDENVTIGFAKNESVVGSQSFDINSQFKELTFTLYNSAWSDDDGKVGAILKRNTNNGGDLEIEYISIKPTYINELPPTQQSAYVISGTITDADITVFAKSTDGTTTATAVIKIISGNIITLLNTSTDTTKLSIAVSQTANFNIVLSGSLNNSATLNVVST